MNMEFTSRLITRPKIENMPRMISRSWTRARMALTPYRCALGTRRNAYQTKNRIKTDAAARA